MKKAAIPKITMSHRSCMLREAAKPPTIDSTKISGARIVNGILSIQMNKGMKARLIKSAAIFEI